MGNQDSISLGLDIGGTKLKALALRGSEEVLDEYVLPSNASGGPEGVRKAVGDAVRYFQKKQIPFVDIGVGCAGSVDNSTGVVRNSPNFSNWKDVPLRGWIEEDFGLPASVDNDAKCAVLAEWTAGSAKGFDNVVLLTLGTGIGGGLILNGRLYRGATGTAGELGHITIHSDGVHCPCGNRGCFERYCSATSVKERAGGISPKEVFSKANENPQYRQIVDRFLYDFQIGLTGIANAFDPDCILLGGAVSEGVAIYIPRIVEWLKSHAFPAVGARVQVKQTRFKNLSGAIGAAHLVSFDKSHAARPAKFR